MLHNKKGAALLQVLLITVVLAGMAAMLLRASLSRTTTARKTRRTVASQMLINTCQAEVSALWGIKSHDRFAKDLENCWMQCSCTPAGEEVYDLEQLLAADPTNQELQMRYLTARYGALVAEFCQQRGLDTQLCTIAKNYGWSTARACEAAGGAGTQACGLYQHNDGLNQNVVAPCQCQDGVTASRSYECSPVTVDGVTYTVTASFSGNKTPEEQCELKYILDDGITTSTDVIL